jgi:NAD(P)-dependent dehydrogenase (short-subunit alcohol dehydrogenase family)
MPHFLVIGGTRGTGRALVKKLTQEGQAVSVLARRVPDETDQATGARYWVGDLNEADSLKRALSEIVAAGGKINTLAFLQRYRGEGDSWAGEMQTSLTATKNAIDFLSGHFVPGGENSIIIVNSNASEVVVDEQPLSYHTAKAALLQVVRFYALKLGPAGIRVNGVCPITILKNESKEFYLNNPALMDIYRKIIPLGRLGTAEEVCNVICFLASSAASFITGQNLTVDGGISLRGHEAVARILIPDAK